jgi:hypothetical protein
VKTAITTFALVLAVLVGATAPTAAVAAEPGLIRLEVTIGKSQVIDLKEPFTRMSVTNPNIADVFAITPTQISRPNGSSSCSTRPSRRPTRSFPRCGASVGVGSSSTTSPSPTDPTHR